ncbi:hypothetical protein AGMMS50229_00720 [Campylobacterota bacterium]|nr:hypothetical protein AGMMS50229_00720 [Campylobacterota bacterium]
MPSIKHLRHPKTTISLMILAVILVSVKYIDQRLPIKLFFYAKNGQTIEMEHYKITLPFPEWIYFGENEVKYLVTSNDLIVEIFTDDRVHDIDLDYLSTHCISLEETDKIYYEISGTEYLCSIDNAISMFFISDDNYIFIRSTTYLQDEKSAKLYQLLFNSFRKISRQNPKQLDRRMYLADRS